MSQVKTAAVTGRRTLRFASMGDILADAEEVTSRPHEALGNWRDAQIIDHVALFIEGSRVGFSFRVPWWLRLVGRAIRGRALHQPLKPGIAPPAKMFRKLAPREGVTLAEAMDRLRREVELASQPGSMTQPSPLFGRLTHEQWVQLHCRHAEMHFSFMR